MKDNAPNSVQVQGSSTKSPPWVSIKETLFSQGVFSCGPITTKIKMKFFLIFLACFGLSYGSLRDDLLELTSTIPIDEWKAVSARFREGDSEYGRVLGYLQGATGDWQGLVERVRDNAQWQGFKDWLLERGVDLQIVVDQVHDLINGVEIGPGGDMGGVRALVDECLEYFSLDAVAAKLDELLSDSGDFVEFFERISSSESRSFLEDFLFDDYEVQYLVETLTAYGIDVQRVKDVLYGLLGWA
nr:uncharacterized protein LOC111419752 [Onthophagus taurus]